MTSKSIDHHIQRHAEAETLVLFEPDLEPDEGHRRRLWLHPDLHSWLYPANPTKRERRAMATVRAFLKGFVTGEDFDSDDLLKLLEPPSDKLYEFRITFNPETRIFGAFYRTGEFIAALHKSRDHLASDGFDKWTEKSNQRLNGLMPGVPRSEQSRTELLREYYCD